MTTTRARPFLLAPLPYAENALEPLMSAKTLGFHFGKHHRAYAENLERLLADETELASLELEDLIRSVAGDPARTRIFDNAAQVWNHTFFWNSLKPGGGGRPAGRLAIALDASFGDLAGFQAAFTAAAKAHFGSGWLWLIEDGGKLAVLTTPNAETPMARGKKCLLTLDLWEHAYYLDHQDRRAEYVSAFLEHLVNWEFAAHNLGGNAPARRVTPARDLSP